MSSQLSYSSETAEVKLQTSSQRKRNTGVWFILHYLICYSTFLHLDINIDTCIWLFFFEIQLLQALLERHMPTFLLNSSLSHKYSDIIHIWHFLLKKALTMWQVCICWMQRSSQRIVMEFGRNRIIRLYENCNFW